MKQTAIEWLIEELGEYFPHEIGGIHLMVNKAKEMERQQTEISDEEIEKGAKEWYEKEGAYKPSAIALNTWLNACKWYKEQLQK